MWWIGTVAVLLGLAAVGIALATEPRRAETAPPRRGPVTPHELRTAELSLVTRGYAPGPVEALLARAARTIESLQARVHELEPPPADAPPSGEVLEDGGGDRPGGLDR